MDKKTVMKNYTFLIIMLAAMVLGCIAGWFSPASAMLSSPSARCLST